MSKKKDKIIVTFIGNSNADVTGSSILIEYPKNKKEYGSLLLELGLVQGEPTFDKDISKNRKMLDNLPKELISNIDFVLLGHAHIDHVGNLPYLNKENEFKGKIIATKQTIEITKELITDSVNIHEKNIEKLKSLGKKTRHLYKKSDMYNMFEYMNAIDINTKIKLNDYITVEFVNSGHCLGGSMIKLWIKKPNQSVFHCIYTSDMGSEYNKILHPMSQHREQINKCNLLISEGTYSNKEKSFNKNKVEKEFNEFKCIIKQSILEGKRVLLPVFSFSKTQEFMCLLYEWLKDEEWFKDIPIILDGVLMHKITNVYLKTLDDENKSYFNKVCNWSNFKINKTYDGTIAILSKRTTGIYLASSGFCQQGRVVSYLKQFLGCSKDVIIFTGYIGGEGSIGWKIACSNQKTVTIEKQTILKRALIKQFHCFSGHIQYDELMSLFKGVSCNKILIHHSGNEKENFVKEIKQELEKCSNTAKVEYVTKKNNQFVF